MKIKFVYQVSKYFVNSGQPISRAESKLTHAHNELDNEDYTQCFLQDLVVVNALREINC
jgi:hypothetical protein